MGQYHSTSSHTGSDNNDGGIGEKVDYYELLGVEQNASGEEIKKAYRRRALELHPDRNYGNAENATRLFAEIQSAYEVLSDPQERAWYDSHRDIFLRSDGNNGKEDYSYNNRMTTSDDILKLFSKFNPRMDFSDSETGFFGGLRKTFAQLALEEKTASQWDSMNFADYPTFGVRDDGFENVVRPFYTVWGGFSTRKSFAWKDVYRYSEAPDRRVRRLMEKENKRLRDEAIREFNDAVRSLVAFVKKRDPRYKASAQSEAQRQEYLRQSVAAQAARSRAANQSRLREHVIPDWAKSEELDNDQYESPEENEMERFECVVCHKNFKSQKQFEAHERSKKHIKAIRQLRWEILAEDEKLNLVPDGIENSGEYSEAKPSQDNNDDYELTTTYQPMDETSSSKPDAIAPAEKEDTKPNLHPNSREGSDSSGSLLPSVTETQHFVSNAEGVDSDYAPREYVESRILPEKHSENRDEMYILADDLASATLSELPSTAAKKMGKAKQKRAKREAQKAMEGAMKLSCATCNTSFPSKTQLFSHIRELEHAQPLPTNSRGKGRMP